ncbi:MAG: hypothetical protein AAB597_00600 [Patescibacteria group bacterium]
MTAWSTPANLIFSLRILSGADGGRGGGVSAGGGGGVSAGGGGGVTAGGRGGTLSVLAGAGLSSIGVGTGSVGSGFGVLGFGSGFFSSELVGAGSPLCVVVAGSVSIGRTGSTTLIPVEGAMRYPLWLEKLSDFIGVSPLGKSMFQMKETLADIGGSSRGATSKYPQKICAATGPSRNAELESLK